MTNFVACVTTLNIPPSNRGVQWKWHWMRAFPFVHPSVCQLVCPSITHFSIGNSIKIISIKVQLWNMCPRTFKQCYILSLKITFSSLRIANIVYFATFLHTAQSILMNHLFVGPLVRRSVGPSVHPSVMRVMRPRISIWGSVSPWVHRSVGRLRVFFK